MRGNIDPVIQIMEHVENLFLVTNHSGKIFFVNQAFAKYLNESQDDFHGKPISDVLHGIPMDLITSMGSIQLQSETFQVNGKRTDNSQLPFVKLVWTQVYWCKEIEEQVLGILLEKPKKSENFEQQMSGIDIEQVLQIFEAIVDPAIMISEKGIILGMNEATVQTFAYSRDKMVGKNVSMLMPQHIAEQHDQYLRKYKETGQRKIIGIGREVAGRRRDGSQFPLHLSVGELITSEGSKVFIGTLNDLTQRDALTAAKAAAEAKDQFLANMSHELRTPLNAILTFSQLLLSTNLTNEQRGPLEKILQSGKRLLHEVEQLLTFSKLDAKKHDIDLVPFDLKHCLRMIVSVQEATLKENLVIVTEIEENVPQKIKSDPHALVTILSNLLSNAVKFSRDSAVNGDQIGIPKEVKLMVRKSSSSSMTLVYSVSDQGIGIKEEKQEQIFAAFSQEDVTTTRKYGGTGLGLTIVQKLVQILNGSIELKSSPGEGSVFTVSLPYLPVMKGETLENISYLTGETDIPRTPVEPRAGRVLVAEDDEFNIVAIESILIRLGFQENNIRKARNGVEAVEVAEKEKFDIILMDRQMPKLDGIEATRRIRKFSLNKRTPIIALTAAVLEQSEKSCKEAGMNDFCGKPIHIPTLNELLNKWLVNVPSMDAAQDEIEESLPVIDEAIFQENFDLYGSNKIIQLIETAVQSISKNLDLLSFLIDNPNRESQNALPDNTPGIESISHTLKGITISMIGGVRLGQMTQKFYEHVCLWKQRPNWELEHKAELKAVHFQLAHEFGLFKKHLANIHPAILRTNSSKRLRKPRRAEVILIADDDPSNLLLLQSILEAEGYTVIASKNGVEALEFARKKLPDLILLDVFMPGLSGFEVCVSLKQEPDLKDIPIIFGTASVSESDGIAQGFHVGGCDYISKPYYNKREELLARIQTHIGLNQITKELKKTIQELNETQANLIETAHQAGMADITENILHNIRNILNGVSTSSSSIKEFVDLIKNDLNVITKIVSLLISVFESKNENAKPFDAEKANLSVHVLNERVSFFKRELANLDNEIQIHDSHFRKIKKILNLTEEIYLKDRKIETCLITYHPKMVIENELQYLLPQLEEHDIDIEFECVEVGIPIQIAKFNYVIRCLLSNSIDAIRAGSVNGKIKIIGESKNGFFELFIVDNGVPFPKEHPSEIFRQNYHDPQCRRSFDGMHMCYSFVKQMNGKLMVVNPSTFDNACFRLEFPLALK